MMASDKLAAIEEVDIDASGTFKYVLINCYLDDKTKQIIRGHAWAQWHGKINSEYFSNSIPHHQWDGVFWVVW